ncbi:unnamed protein product (macronuclear) [Paramecium tetraurelia]|uniref:Uncharacterized protein n=1 Tax=Paramecium tetraurelia TaxID=5888 RepID=A0BMM7_PARTE|nr:uncharacterized protein GSPATT00030430001 [Paramecium tetraurelia]CAK59794.1 unnamed protein product [Paramecium tetraurelia]|eukprot:XP_001427192.1 hypothetical protein (macronuclear) [Paramecium tetraurelia strain d4-2]
MEQPYRQITEYLRSNIQKLKQLNIKVDRYYLNTFKNRGHGQHRTLYQLFLVNGNTIQLIQQYQYLGLRVQNTILNFKLKSKKLSYLILHNFSTLYLSKQIHNNLPAPFM